MRDIRERIRLKHYSIRTERAHCDWIRRFAFVGGKARQSALGAVGVDAVPPHLEWPHIAGFGKIAERLLPKTRQAATGTKPLAR